MSNTETLHIIKQFITDYTLYQNCEISTPLYAGRIPIGNSTYSVVGVFFDSNPHSLADQIIKCHDCDIILLMNIHQKVVLLRRGHNCDLDLSKLAKKLSTGGGKPDVAGCLLNDRVISITKLLHPC